MIGSISEANRSGSSAAPAQFFVSGHQDRMERALSMKDMHRGKMRAKVMIPKPDFDS